MQFVLLNTFDNYIEANIVLGRLQSENIVCWLKDENMGTLRTPWDQTTGGIKLMVAEQQIDRALNILKDISGTNQ